MSGIWVVRKYQSNHVKENGDVAHIAGEEVYKLSRNKQKLVEGDVFEKLKSYTKLNAPTTTIAEKLSTCFDVDFEIKDILNRKKKLVDIMGETVDDNISLFLNNLEVKLKQNIMKKQENVRYW